jgi:hypothetical protein
LDVRVGDAEAAPEYKDGMRLDIRDSKPDRKPFTSEFAPKVASKALEMLSR